MVLPSLHSETIIKLLSYCCKCKLGFTSLHDFYCRSLGSLDILVASLVFMKDTSCSCCVIMRNTKWSRAVRSCYGKYFEVIGLHDFRSYLHVASSSVTPL